MKFPNFCFACLFTLLLSLPPAEEATAAAAEAAAQADTKDGRAGGHQQPAQEARDDTGHSNGHTEEGGRRKGRHHSPSARRLLHDLQDSEGSTGGTGSMGSTGGTGGGGLPAHDSPKKRRPNIVLMLTDDQDVELGSLQFMPKLNRYLREQGAMFEHGFVSTPMCCPSRSSLLTGLYSHNHHVLTNNENCSATEWVQVHEPRTFAAYLNEAGYKTGYFGKYLNKYNGNHIPIGWDEWSGLVRNSRFYNYTINVNGNKVRHGFDYAKDYFPDLITNSSLSFLRRSKQQRPDSPVLMVLSYPGPHGPEDSAPQFKDLFHNVTTHHTPAYDYAPNPDKQWILQVTERMEPIHKRFTDLLMTKRLQTLQSIDDGIERLYNELLSLGELDNTYIFYTSDHGYHLGQFGLVKGKSFPFDVDIKVPFFVRGPGLKAGEVRREPVLNIDLAPTFLDIGGVAKPPHMDGGSLMDIIKGEKPWRDSFLVERGKMTHVRFEQIYPNKTRHNSVPDFGDADDEHDNDGEGEDEEEGSEEFDTSGSRILEMARLTKQERLAVECLKPRHQAPCAAFQRHKCVRKKNGDWKMKKCRSKNYIGDIEGELPCHCKAGAEFGWRRTEEEDDIEGGFVKSERKLQRDFLKKHTSDKTRRVRRPQKFLKELGGAVKSGGRRRRFRGQRRRRVYRDLVQREEEAEAEAEKEVTVEVEKPVEVVLDDIAKEEIDEVDIIMEDISDEINDLQQSMNGSAPSTHRPPDLQCHVTDSKEVNCSSNIYISRSDWKHSRAFINEQIRRLRSQLFELKEIRKHLKMKRPFMQADTLDGNEVLLDYEDVKEEDQIPAEAVECQCNEKNLRNPRKSRRQRLKQQRLQQRLRRKQKRQRDKAQRKPRKEHKKSKVRSCNSETNSKLNCFSHDNQHWRTPPFWTDGNFCACTNSNTNTYWCVRTVNLTHNYLYCEFVSGVITYYDLNVDPYQLRNIYQTLSDAELNFMHQQLRGLKRFSGYDLVEGGDRMRKKEERRVANLKESPSSEQHRSKNMLETPHKSFIHRYGQYLPPLEAYHQSHKRRRYFS